VNGTHFANVPLFCYALHWISIILRAIFYLKWNLGKKYFFLEVLCPYASITILICIAVLTLLKFSALSLNAIEGWDWCCGRLSTCVLELLGSNQTF